jgi:hypothetical protein
MKKPIYALLGILLLFVIVYLLLIQKEKKTFSPGRVEHFLELDSASVDRIEFKKYGTKLAFQKLGRQWYIVRPDSCRADGKAIGQLVSLASNLSVGEIISSNKQKQVLFNVDSLTGTGLDFYSGERRLASMVVGKMSDDYMHAYLRKTESDDVYLGSGILSSIAQQRVDHWRDRRILIFDPEQVKEVEVSRGEEKFKLTRADTVWQLSPHPYQETTVADNQKAEDYIRALADVKTDEFANEDETAALDFENPQLVLKITLLDGYEERLLAVREEGEGNRYFVKTDPGILISVLFEYSFKRLAQRLEDFQPKEES